MTKAKRSKPRVVAPEWRGFSGRLKYAIEVRQQEEPGLTQNRLAEMAGVDGGNLSKIVGGTKAAGATANTVILLARALRVRPNWLLTGEEPSGLGPPITHVQVPIAATSRAEETPKPSSSVRPSSPPRKAG